MHFAEFYLALLCRGGLPSYHVLLIENFAHAGQPDKLWLFKCEICDSQPKLATTPKALCKQVAHQLGDCNMLDRLTTQGMDK